MTPTFSGNNPGYLTAAELVERWRGQVNVETLASWRSRGNGPRFVKIGGRVLYPIADVEEYERKNRR